MVLRSVDDVKLSIRRIVCTEVNLVLATRFKEIVTQLSDSSHVSQEQMQQFLCSAHKSGVWIFGSFEGDLLVSTVSLYLDRHPWGIEGRINNVVTDKPYESRGHGTRLFEHLWQALPGICPIGRDILGLYKLTLCASNPRAIALYEKFGFRKDKEQEMRMDVTRDLFSFVL